MRTSDDDRADAWFHALSDRTRRDILRRTLAEEQSVSALARDYPISLTAVQKHVAALERAGLLRRRRSGRETLARADVDGLHGAARLLEEIERRGRAHIARIDELLEGESAVGASSIGQDTQVSQEPQDDAPSARPPGT